MTEDESIAQYECLDETEPNTVRLCPQCMGPEMVIRDPRRLADKSVFSYCGECGLTWSVHIITYS